MNNYTIICVDIDANDNIPVVVSNYGLMAKKQAEIKLLEIYEKEKEWCKELDMGGVTIECTNTYVGLLFDEDYEGELHRRVYYLQELGGE